MVVGICYLSRFVMMEKVSICVWLDIADFYFPLLRKPLQYKEKFQRIWQLRHACNFGYFPVFNCWWSKRRIQKFKVGKIWEMVKWWCLVFSLLYMDKFGRCFGKIGFLKIIIWRWRWDMILKIGSLTIWWRRNFKIKWLRPNFKIEKIIYEIIKISIWVGLEFYNAIERCKWTWLLVLFEQGFWIQDAFQLQDFEDKELLFI